MVTLAFQSLDKELKKEFAHHDSNVAMNPE